MKRILVIGLFLLLGMSTIVNAHAPKKIQTEYNSETGILKVVVPHPVKDVTKHYIEEIVITINGEETKMAYTEQSSKESHVAELEFPDLEKGSVVDIYAKCNKLGSKNTELVIE